MLRHKNNFIGDTWYYVNEDTVHCYYLTCPTTIERHTAWDIGHAVSTDLINWSDHQIVLKKGKFGEWDDTCLATGSVIKHDGRFWMAYTAKWDKPDVAVGIAVSDDLYHWEKIGNRPMTQIDDRYYERTGSGSRPISHWRDPFLFSHEGYIYHAVCASKNTGPIDSRGTVGLARTKNFLSWEVIPPPEIEEVAAELECPQLHVCGDKYLLVFSSSYELFSQEMQVKYGKSGLPHSAYAMWSNSIFGPYHFSYQKPLIPKHYPVKPYAIQVVNFKGNTYLMGTVWDFEHDNDFVTNPIPVTCDGEKFIV